MDPLDEIIQVCQQHKATKAASPGTFNWFALVAQIIAILNKILNPPATP